MYVSIGIQYWAIGGVCYRLDPVACNSLYNPGVWGAFNTQGQISGTVTANEPLRCLSESMKMTEMVVFSKWKKERMALVFLKQHCVN